MMIVLYAPFPRDASGDLAPLVDNWKYNHELNSTQPLLILFYGDDIDLDKIHSCFEIYICAHGWDNYPSQLGNYADVEQADLVSMETVADRFSSDFLVLSHQISVIHCYCCGSEEKNQALAKMFRSHLLRSEMPICSYGGSLYGANSQGMLWCVNNNEQMPISRTCRILYDETEQSFTDTWVRQPFKVQVLEQFIEQAREKRLHRFFTHQKEKRKEAFARLRYDNDVVESPPSSPSPYQA